MQPMQPMQMMNMFGAVRPRMKVRQPYSDTERTTIPTKSEAASVRQSLQSISADEILEEDLPLHTQAISILADLQQGNVRSFLSLSEHDFQALNQHIGQALAQHQISILEDQAEQESDDFVRQNAYFFDHLREEGLNYDHLNDEQIQLMRLRMRERDLSQTMESNAKHIDGEVYYQFEVGPDNRYYKSGGVVMASSEQNVTRDTAEQVSRQNPDHQMGQFADVNALKMPQRQGDERSKG